MPHKTPTLVPVDLTKGDSHGHPDIKIGSWYLARVDKEWIVGTFSKEWYGLHFDCTWGASGMQYHKPGTNSSGWRELYLIQR